MPWKLQRARRKTKTRDGWYCQVIWYAGSKRSMSVTLGWLDDHGDEDEVFARWKARVVAAPGINSIVTSVGADGVLPTDPEAVKRAIKRWITDDSEDLVSAVLAAESSRAADAALKSGDYGSLPLRDYCQRVWFPIRKRDNRGSWKREESRWNAILGVLGHHKLSQLTAIRWHLFLESQTTWGPTSKRLAQNAYRVLLKHAVNLEILSGDDGSRSSATPSCLPPCSSGPRRSGFGSGSSNHHLEYVRCHRGTLRTGLRDMHRLRELMRRHRTGTTRKKTAKRRESPTRSATSGQHQRAPMRGAHGFE